MTYSLHGPFTLRSRVVARFVPRRDRGGCEVARLSHQTRRGRADRGAASQPTSLRSWPALRPLTKGGPMNHRLPRSAVVALSVLIASAGATGGAVADLSSAPARHVLLISVDGLHASDVTKCMAAHLCPTI